MSNYIFTLCGRAGSKGIQGKNIGLFLEIPLVYYTLASIVLYKERHPEDGVAIVLSTDSDRLVELVTRSGVPFHLVKRPAYLATDTVSKLEVIRHAYKEAAGKFQGHCDAVVDLDITAPLRTVADLEALIQKREKSSASTVFSVTSSRRNPYFNMVMQGESGYFERVIMSSYSARQEAPQIYDMNASMYAYNPAFLENETQMFDSSCDVVVMKDTAVLDLDSEDDLVLMEVIAKHLFAVDANYGEIYKAAQKIGGEGLDRL